MDDARVASMQSLRKIIICAMNNCEKFIQKKFEFSERKREKKRGGGNGGHATQHSTLLALLHICTLGFQFSNFKFQF